MNTQFPKPDKKEILTLLVIVLIGVALRLYGISSVTVEHFDEGVYASNLWFGPENNFEYPQRPFYAPSMLPALIEFMMTIFGPGTVGVLGVNLLAGILTIPMIWLLSRSWFGPHAGLISAALCSFSEFHIAYSRTALTDPSLLFWFLLAVYLGSKALQYSSSENENQKLFDRLGGRNGILSCLAAGVATSLAWWTKYNGWLPLAVLISGYAGWRIINFKNGESILEPIIKLSIIITTAYLLWLPYLNSLKDIGGYSAVAENHQKYVVGLAGWKESFFRQGGNLFQFESGIGWILFCLVLLGCFMVDWKKNPALASLSTFTYVLLYGFSMAIGVSNSLFVFVIIMIWWAFSELGINLKNIQYVTRLPYWLLAAWMIGLTVATPLYNPYPRLVLPLLASIWVGGGFCYAMLQEYFERSGHEHSERYEEVKKANQDSWKKNSKWMKVALIIYAIHFCFSVPKFIERIGESDALQARNGFQEIAKKVVEETDGIAISENLEPEKNAFYVYAEPGLFFQLAAEDKLVGPTGNLKFADPERNRLPVPTFLLTGPHASRSVEFEEQWDLYGAEFDKVAEYPYQPSSIVLLNNMSATDLKKAKKEDLVETITLYRLREKSE